MKNLHPKKITEYRPFLEYLIYYVFNNLCQLFYVGKKIYKVFLNPIVIK